MRLRIFSVVVFVAFSVASAQAPVPKDLKLRGNRFKPLTYDELTPEQKTMVEHLYAGERGGTNGPFNVTLRSPEMGDLAQKLGAQLRFHSALSAKQRELAIILTARDWTAQYEWYAHSRLALQAGIPKDAVAAIAAGKRPMSLGPDEMPVYNFVNELLKTRQVSDPVFKSAVDKLGEKGVVDLTGLVTYYGFVSAMLNIDGYPLPENAKPELAPLK
ncbi:MAG TPA: carboxymuconolactone decarboxylase family protein [Bryobacteraceae bacterium]|nr:carboxymuconolactone decarboxylase family protein [Bryobacteraceae bacterium]